MKHIRQTIITLVVGLVAAQATAGITGPVPQDSVICKGPGIEVRFEVNKGSYKGGLLSLQDKNSAVFYINDSATIDNSLAEGLIKETGWDKTAFLADIGININTVSDHISFLVENKKVVSVGGGRIDYATMHGLHTGSQIGKFTSPVAVSKASVTQLDNTTYEVSMLNVGAELQKCVKTALVPNPWAPGELFEDCVAFQQVKPQTVLAGLSKNFSIKSCKLK